MSRTVMWWCEDRSRTDAVRKSKFMPLLDSDLELWIVIFTHISSKTMNRFEFCISWDWFCWFWGCIALFPVLSLHPSWTVTAAMTLYTKTQSRSVQATNWQHVPQILSMMPVCLSPCQIYTGHAAIPRNFEIQLAFTWFAGKFYKSKKSNFWQG